MATDRCSSVTPRLVVGLAVVALGVVFLLGNLGLIRSRDVLVYFWPIVFLTLGFVMLVERWGRRGWFWSWVWIFAGSWLLGYQLGWVTYPFWDLFFPLFLLLMGGRVVLGAFRPSPRMRAERVFAGGTAEGDERVAADGSEVVHAFAVLAGNERRVGSDAFRGGDLSAFLGAVKLDLTGAKLAGESATIDVVAVWGGIEIRVPADWTVVGEVAPVLGAYEDKTRPPAVAGKRLVIRGLAVMAGVEVKN